MGKDIKTREVVKEIKVHDGVRVNALSYFE